MLQANLKLLHHKQLLSYRISSKKELSGFILTLPEQPSLTMKEQVMEPGFWFNMQEIMLNDLV